ncbi:MAG TPA: sigma 54-interacting transcriptional regulator [Gemmatimonadales bacterium]|nr:sigma 54-interacting transcriptional regulator [Gemmatimonadales bacterium]
MTTPEISLLVVRLTDSFSDFWPLLAGELKVPLDEWRPAEGEPPPPGAAVILLAAGGVEPDLPAHIRDLTVPSDVPIVAIGAAAGHRIAAQAVAAGAADYFVLPDDRDALREVVAAAVARRRAAVARSALARLEAQAHAFREIVGESPALRATLERAARVLPHADATVLITGETGTGKELVARALHYGGPRAAAPFIELNCAAVPAQLLESELFGHERGAFTDAKSAKPGLFEAADGGTLLLDEIDRLAPELQSKLLRALEEKTTRRLGATTGRRVDVRIIAATNAELAAEVRAGTFREDLFYRLNVISLQLPPLRERGEDVLLLAEAFLARFSAQYGLPQPPLNSDARRILLAHAWPGNVRELRNAIERALLLSPPGTLEIAELTATQVTSSRGNALPFPASLDDIVRSAARAMLAATGGNRSEAARRLGISRSRLARLLGGEAEADSE